MERRRSVLVVEDQVNERETLLRFLRSEGYLAFGAATASDAFDYYEDAELVLCDAGLGDINGIQLLKMWKRRHAETPFILITAHGEVDAAVEAVKSGAEDYLVKPISPDDLLAKISACFERDHHAYGNGSNGKESAVRPPTSNGAGTAAATTFVPGASLAEIERSAIQRTLAECSGNRTRAAQALGISVRTLQRKLKMWGEGASPKPVGLPR